MEEVTETLLARRNLHFYTFLYSQATYSLDSLRLHLLFLWWFQGLRLACSFWMHLFLRQQLILVLPVNHFGTVIPHRKAAEWFTECCKSINNLWTISHSCQISTTNFKVFHMKMKDKWYIISSCSFSLSFFLMNRNLEHIATFWIYLYWKILLLIFTTHWCFFSSFFLAKYLNFSQVGQKI